MNVKMVELKQTEQVLKKMCFAVEALYEANTKKDEREIKRLTKDLEKFQYEVNKEQLELEKKETELKKIKEIYLPGIGDGDLEDLESLEKFIGIKREGQKQNASDIAKANEYYNLILATQKITDKIDKIKSSIEKAEAKKEEKIQKAIIAKEKFANEYTTLINRLCQSGRIKIQKIKVSFAGEKIALNSNGKELASLTLEDLKKLNKISLLIETKSKIEEVKNSSDKLLKNKKLYLEKLERKLEESILAVDSKALQDELDERIVEANCAKNAKASADAMEIFAKFKKLKANNPILVAIKNEQEVQNSLYNLAISEINRLQDILINSKRSIKEKKIEIEKAKKTFKYFSDENAIIASQLNEVSNNLFNKLSSIVGDESLTTEQAVEKINESMSSTPFVVKNLSKQDQNNK